MAAKTLIFAVILVILQAAAAKRYPNILSVLVILSLTFEGSYTYIIFIAGIPGYSL